MLKVYTKMTSEKYAINRPDCNLEIITPQDGLSFRDTIDHRIALHQHSRSQPKRKALSVTQVQNAMNPSEFCCSLCYLCAYLITHVYNYLSSDQYTESNITVQFGDDQDKENNPILSVPV